MHRRRPWPALAALGLALVLGTAAVWREPARGLRLRVEGREGETVDRRIHFATGDGAHPVPAWVGQASRAEWRGFLLVPRKGSYLLRLWSDGGARLTLDDALALEVGAHATRARERELVLEPGFHRLRLTYEHEGGDALMKLEWRLPAGYHTPGLLPVSSLFPEAPDPPGPLDRGLRLGAVLALLAAGALALRPLAGPVDRSTLAAALAVATLALAVRLATLEGPGETCDEWAYLGAAHVYANNLVSGIFDADQWRVNREHPAVGKLLYAVVQWSLGPSPLFARGASALLATLTVLVAFAVARRLLGLHAAAAAGIVLALVPPFVAHGAIAGLDTPATFFFTLSVALLLRVLVEPEERTSTLVLLGLAMGLGIATKLSVGLVAPFSVLALLAVRGRALRHGLGLPWTAWLVPILAALPFFATWPWLWHAPVAHLQETLGHWRYRPPELFLGDFGRPPWTYLLFSFVAATPLGVLVLALVGGVGLAIGRAPLRPLPDGSLASARAVPLLLLGWLLVPFAWSFSGFRQDGIRYVHAAYVPLALFVGAGVAWLGARLGGLGTGALTTALGAYLGWQVAGVHPYLLDYFGEQVGGPRGVYERRLLETGWWGEGIDRALAWLGDHAPEAATWSYRGMVDHTLEGVRPDLRRVRRGGDFVVRADLDPHTEVLPGYERVFSVEVRGAPLVAVYRRRR